MSILTNGPEVNVAYINKFLNNRLGLQLFNGMLANPRAWSVSANAYSELCVENPIWFRQYNLDGRLQLVIGRGNDLNMFLNNLVASNSNSPNTNLWITVCNQYRNSVAGFTNAILGSLAMFNTNNGFTVNNGYPADFNPFTDRFLSVVITNAGAISDGYYPTASVASVTAMACSPTLDGMPVYFIEPEHASVPGHKWNDHYPGREH